MEEFISKNKLIKELIDKGFYPALVKSAIENAPTEDVVPRKQSENWKEIAIAYQKQFEDTYEDKQMAIKQAKQEVAREIFEEINKYVCQLLATSFYTIEEFVDDIEQLEEKCKRSI